MPRRKTFELRWVRTDGTLRVDTTWNLYTPAGKLCATVWGNGTWHTWDENGVGGENSICKRIDDAKRECIASLFVQGWHGMSIVEQVPPSRAAIETPTNTNSYGML